MTWADAVWAGLKRVADRTGSKTVTRTELIRSEMDQIKLETRTRSKAPHYTLNRILQMLRDRGRVKFIDNNGTYEIQTDDQAVFSESIVSLPKFIPGEIYKRKALHDEYGGQQQGGICTPVKVPIIILFTGDSGNDYGYHFDGWKNDIFEYAGEGQSGDMSFIRGNKAIRDHIKNHKNIYLFEDVGLGVRYIGEMAYVRHHIRRGPDKDGIDRSVIVFELKQKEDGSRKRGKWTKERGQENGEDANFQQAISETPPAVNLPLGIIPPQPPRRRSGMAAYQRNPGIARKCMEEMGYKCEADPSHLTFISRATDKPYIEAHHLIPIAYQGDFPEASLDVPENILILCPLCHRKFHHGYHEPEMNLIERFYTLRKELLKARGIELSIDTLRNYYLD